MHFQRVPSNDHSIPLQVLTFNQHNHCSIGSRCCGKIPSEIHPDILRQRHCVRHKDSRHVEMWPCWGVSIEPGLLYGASSGIIALFVLVIQTCARPSYVVGARDDDGKCTFLHPRHPATMTHSFICLVRPRDIQGRFLQVQPAKAGQIWLTKPTSVRLSQRIGLCIWPSAGTPTAT